LLITQHRPGEPIDGKRPFLETKMLFRGVHGRLELDLSGKDKSQAGAVAPTFYSLAGDPSRHQGDALYRLFALPLCQSTQGRTGRQRSRQISKPRQRENPVIRWRGRRDGGVMQERLKNYAFVTCLFVFLFITIGGALHLNPCLQSLEKCSISRRGTQRVASLQDCPTNCASDHETYFPSAATARSWLLFIESPWLTHGIFQLMNKGCVFLQH
jgi:hypothetical protein